tara:strand:+ start:988 stop:1788 length:801 start_codon:yes stop_codon:yes gene_type:complete
MKSNLFFKRICGLSLFFSTLPLFDFQSSYAEGIMSSTPVTVVVAEFINESDAGWWKPKYKSSFKNMLTNALSNTGNFTVLEEDEEAIERMTKKRTLGIIPGFGGSKEDTSLQAKYIIKGYLSEYSENEVSESTQMDFGAFGGGRMSQMFGKMGMSTTPGGTEKSVKEVDLTFNVVVINPRTKARAYTRTIQGTAKEEFLSENIDMGFVKSQKKVENKFPIKRAVMQAMEESGKYLNCVLYLQDDCIDEMDAKEAARQSNNEAMDLF